VLHPGVIVRHRIRRRQVTMTGKWADFDQLTFDLSDWLEHESNHTKASLLMRALSYIYWQRTVIEEVKGERSTLEAMLRDK